MRSALFLVLGCVGCYSPSYRDCDISCATGTCPSGLSCNSEQRCVADMARSCGSDMPMPDSSTEPDATVCTAFSFPISNIPCPPDEMAAWTITGTQTIVAAPNGAGLTVPGSPPYAELTNNNTAILIVAHDILIDSAATLTIRANSQGVELPLIIVATGTMHLDGTINVVAARGTDAATLAQCGTSAGGLGADCGQNGSTGGGGGAFGPGAIGAAGGTCSTLPTGGGAAGMAGGSPGLTPLRGGCPGGGGTHGPMNNIAGGPGGFGGGVLQISAKTLSLTGTITVPGGGGIHGPNTTDGAGGGGSGGAILLESAMGTLTNTAKVCAHGGGGGSETGDGAPGTCAASGAAGGPSPGTGGTGAYGNTPATPGASGSISPSGGGGGGVGRIHLNGTFNIDPSAFVSPAPM